MGGKFQLKGRVTVIPNYFVQANVFGKQFLGKTLQKQDVFCRKINKIIGTEWHRLSFSVGISGLFDPGSNYAVMGRHKGHLFL